MNTLGTVLPQSASAIRPGTGISQTLKAMSLDEAAPRPPDPGSAVEIRPIHNAQELETVYRMTHDAYVDMGFVEPRADGRLVHYPHLDALLETTVLVALIDGRIVGTNSLTIDGPGGLHVDEDFKPAADAIRAAGIRLASSYRINTLKEFRHRRDVVMGLIRETARILIEAGSETSLYIFHKRHEGIYRRLLNMETIAELQEIHCVNNFPAVLMRCDHVKLPAWCQPSTARKQHAPRG